MTPVGQGHVGPWSRERPDLPSQPLGRGKQPPAQRVWQSRDIVSYWAGIIVQGQGVRAESPGSFRAPGCLLGGGGKPGRVQACLLLCEMGRKASSKSPCRAAA